MHASVVSDTVVDVLGILRSEYETVFGPVRDDGGGDGGEMRPGARWCLDQRAKNRAEVSRLDAERARLEGLLRADELALVELRGGALAADRRAATLALERSELLGMLAGLAHGVCSELPRLNRAV